MIILGTDHAGFELKNMIKELLIKRGEQVLDVSEVYDDKDDYPDVALALCTKLKENDLGILICGTGIGINMVANKMPGIRAATCYDEYTAKMTRLDNNANVLCLGARTIIAQDKELIEKIVTTFIDTEFSNDERHTRRVQKILDIESRR